MEGLLGEPAILFATDSPIIMGISHSKCAYKQYRYGLFQMCPPDYLSDEQMSFLVQAYYRLYNLPGGQEPNRELRICLATLLQDYPTINVLPLSAMITASVNSPKVLTFMFFTPTVPIRLSGVFPII